MIQITDYTEKSIVVHGEETKNIKDELKNIGGRWNPNLSSPICSGWIFPKTKKAEVTEIVQRYLSKQGVISQQGDTMKAFVPQQKDAAMAFVPWQKPESADQTMCEKLFRMGKNPLTNTLSDQISKKRREMERERDRIKTDILHLNESMRRAVDYDDEYKEIYQQLQSAERRSEDAKIREKVFEETLGTLRKTEEALENLLAMLYGEK